MGSAPGVFTVISQKLMNFFFLSSMTFRVYLFQVQKENIGPPKPLFDGSMGLFLTKIIIMIFQYGPAREFFLQNHKFHS
jgi:hypothetical protein